MAKMNECIRNIIIRDRDEFKQLAKKIEDARSEMFENLSNFEKTGEIAKRLDALYRDLGVVCVNTYIDIVMQYGTNPSPKKSYEV